MSNSERSLQQHKSISYGAFEKPQQGEKEFASVRSLGAIACEADCLYCRVGEMHPSITDNTEQKERREMAEQTLTLDAKQDGITTKIENAKVSSEFSIPEDLYAGEKLPTITNGNQDNLNGNKPIVVKIPFEISDGLDGKKAPNRKSAVVLASRIEYHERLLRYLMEYQSKLEELGQIDEYRSAIISLQFEVLDTKNRLLRRLDRLINGHHRFVVESAVID